MAANLREGVDLPVISDLRTEAEILAVRAMLPKLTRGDPLQSYKCRLSVHLRRVRVIAAGKLPDALARSLIAAAGDTCGDCGESMLFWLTRRFPTIDHITPISKGGTNSRSNLRVICNRCNAKKGNRA